MVEEASVAAFADSLPGFATLTAATYNTQGERNCVNYCKNMYKCEDMTFVLLDVNGVFVCLSLMVT